METQAPAPDQSPKPREGLAAPATYDTTPEDKLFPTWERMLRFSWVAGLVVAGIAGYRFWKPRVEKPLVPVVHFAPASPWSSDPGLTLAPAISPDGNRVAFASDRAGNGSIAIWLRPFDSGEPVRLTSGEFNGSEPDFSPDGHELVFRSERDGGGIYTVPTSVGSQPALVAKLGWRPKYSPDGRWIAYYTLTGTEDSTAAFGVGKIFVVPAGGGEPKQVRPDFPYARYPIWTPDSQRLLFSGTSKDGVKDWWITPLDGGPATRTRAAEFLNHSLRTAGYPEQWHDGEVYFSGAEENVSHVWALPISLSTMQAAGPPRRLTDGKESEQQTAVGPGGRLLYSSLHFSSDIWALPIDADRAEVRGKLKALTTDSVRTQLPFLSSNGSRMAYISNKSGVRDVWVSDPDGTGAHAVTSFRQIGYRPVLSPDGKRVVYPAFVGGKCTVVMESLAAPGRLAALEGCFDIWDWSPDASELLTFQSGRTNTVERLKISTGERVTALSHPTYGLYGVRFSPDGRWLAFTAGPSSPQARIFVAPFRGASPSEREWIAIGPAENAGDPVWSPDGNVLYFHSKLDGYHCIWAQKLGPGKTPVGAPIAILHLHATGFGMTFLKASEFGLTVSRNQLTLNVAKGTGNIWKTTVEEKQ
jgi:Tol biopolymer transport system component